MTGQEVYDTLVARGVRHLHHANSVRTSLSQLRLGGLASRRAVDVHRLPQTSQITDDLDRKYGIWGDIFMDTVDIHERASDRNKYGPVLFVLNVEMLRNLSPSARVLITRVNPSKWGQTSTDAERYFLTSADLKGGLSIGDFNQMLVIRTDNGILPFMTYLEAIVLDEPRLTSGQSAEFLAAADALNTSAAAAGLQIRVTQRLCHPCGCISSYAKKESRIPWFYNLR